jgi:hypothetical protein
MLGVGFLGVAFGSVLVWAGYDDADVLKVLDAIIGRKPMPAHTPGRGLVEIMKIPLSMLAALGGALGQAAKNAAGDAVTSGAGAVVGLIPDPLGIIPDVNAAAPKPPAAPPSVK